MTEPSLECLLQELEARDRRAEDGGGRARQERQSRLGRLTARERIAILVDKDSFQELGRHVVSRHGSASPRLAANLHPGDGLVCGLAAVHGRTVAVYAHDPTVLRGAFGHAASVKLCRLLDLALERRFPVVALVDCDGVRVEEGTDAVNAFGQVIARTIQLKGKVPQVTLVAGLCVGGAAYTAVLTDCVGMVAEQSFMFVTGAKVTKVVTGEDVDLAQLGGPEVHARHTGACHAILADEHAGLAWVQRVLGFLDRCQPAEDPPGRMTPEVGTLVPAQQRRGYDMRKVLDAVLDRGSVLELTPSYGPNLLTALARLGGRAVAVVASQPLALAGCLDVEASRKGAAFVTWVASLGLPIVTLVDVPGYLPGVKQEQGGILPHGAELLTAYGNARVPKVCLVVRKSFGGASVLSFAADVRLALPTARVDPMGPEASLQVVLGAAAGDATEGELQERARQEQAWREQHDHAWAAAESGYLDRVVRPEHVRRELAAVVERLSAQEAARG